MRINRAVLLLIPILLLSLCSCAKTHLSPKNTVKLYLDETTILKDPIYKKAALDELKSDPEKAKRYAEAGKTIDKLIWTDSSANPERRKKLLMSVGTILTFKNYQIQSESVEGSKAQVKVILGKTSLFNKDLGAASQKDSSPITYELIKTSSGWQIKDINGILAKAGL